MMNNYVYSRGKFLEKFTDQKLEIIDNAQIYQLYEKEDVVDFSRDIKIK